MNQWKQIWERKGREDTTDLDLLDGLHMIKDINIKSEWLAKQIIKILKPKPNERILDVGCGAGATARYIAPLCKYVGIDYSKSLVKKHIEILNNTVLVAEANDIPFKDKYFDKSFAFSCFQYFPDKKYARQAIEEMRRVTKNFIFIADVPIEEEGKNHLLYSTKEFHKGIITKGFHNDKRMNVVIELD